jgi:myo-inositol 2-dehydrogenase/D-chiro-inositol 1-dehydrogenase
MQNQKIKIALIGAGGWGRQHVRIFASRSDVDFCAIVGRTPERTQARAAEYGVRAYSDVTEMLKAEQPDLVSLCLPNEGHFDTTLKVIQAGFPLLVEKPLVFELAEANILLQEAAKRDLFFAVNFNHRYAVPVQKTKKAIAEGRLGDVIFATWRFGGEGRQSHPYANLIETQCHGFDQLEYLCGPIVSLMAEMTDYPAHGFSTQAISVRFASGAVGSLVGSYDSSYAYRDTHRLEINGTQGRALIQDTVRRWSFQQSGSETEEVWEAGYFNDRDRQFHHTFDVHIDQILAAFKDGLPPPIPAEAGRRALRLAHAAIESFTTGRRVLLEE